MRGKQKKMSHLKKWKLGLGAACIAGAMLLTVPVVTKAETDVIINTDNFPDAVFRSCLSAKTYDTNQDGKLSKAEIGQITKLNLSGKGIKELTGIENFSKLRELNVNCNQLKALDVSRNTALLYLSCKDNQLKELDLRDNTSITSIDCQNNQLEHLWLPGKTPGDAAAGQPSIKTKGNPDLRLIDLRRCIDWFRAGGYGEFSYDEDTIEVRYDYQLGLCCQNEYYYYIDDAPDGAYLYKGWKEYDGNTYYFGEDGRAVTGTQGIDGLSYFFNQEGVLQEYIDWSQVKVPIDEDYFPDRKFRRRVYYNFDRNGDGVLSYEEADLSNYGKFERSLYASDEGIKSLAGIEYIEGLCYVNIDGNEIEDFDPSQFPDLVDLYCNDNKLSELDVSKCTKLEILNCSNNQIKELNVSQCHSLTYLHCWDNQIKELDTSACDLLFVLWCNGNKGISLKMSKNLRGLNVSGCGLTELDLSDYSDLGELWCDENAGLKLKCPKGLRGLSVNACGLTKLDVNGFTALSTLSCSDNKLTSLDVSGCISLEELDCSGNKNIAFRLHDNLQSLDCSNCNYTKLDLSMYPNLCSVICNDNKLTGIDLSKNKMLTNFECAGNQFVSLDLNGADNLRTLVCVLNPLKRLYVYGSPYMKRVCTEKKPSYYEMGDSYEGIRAKVYQGSYEINSDISGKTSARVCVYMVPDAALITGQPGWVTKNGKKYYYDLDAKLVKGLKKIDGKYYFLDKSTGEMKTGSVTEGGKKYYFDKKTGAALTGKQTINNKTYYYDKTTCAMKTGLLTISGKKYYFDPKTGVMKTGKVAVTKKKVYFFSTKKKTLGQMQKSCWQTVGNKKYYFKASGLMATGKTTISKKTYFFSTKAKTLGQMQKNCWQTIGKKKYYFKSNGVMAKNEYIKGFYVDKSGAKTSKAKCSWRKDKKGKWYGNSKGWYAKNCTLTIDGKKYKFNKAGYVKK